MRIDFHCHVLPKMDDGAESSKQSLEMLLSMKSQGIEKVCCTSHFYPENENPDAFIKRRDASFNRLLEVCRESGFEPPVLLKGAEAAWYQGIGKSDEIKKLCLEGTNILLVEMPFERWTAPVLSSIVAVKEELCLQPVLAHVDRYFDYTDLDTLKELVFGHDVWLQVNASSVFTDLEKKSLFRKKSGSYSPKVYELLKEGMVSFIGSDAHNTKTRTTYLGFVYEVLEIDGFAKNFKEI